MPNNIQESGQEKESGVEAALEDESEPREMISLRSDYGVESYSIGNTLDTMFRESDEMPDIPEVYAGFEVKAEANERAVLQYYLKDILRGLRHEPEVGKFRRLAKKEGYRHLTRENKTQIFRIYDRLRHTALSHVKEKFADCDTDKILRKIKFTTGSDLNYSLRARILEGAEPEAWMILNPKLRKIDLLDSRTLYRFLRNSMNQKGHLEFVKQAVEEGSANKETLKAFEKVKEEHPEMLKKEEPKKT